MSQFPCENCITLGMCKSRYDQRFKEMTIDFPQHSPRVSAIFAIVDNCSILKRYCNMANRLSISNLVIEQVSSFYSDIKG